MARALLDALTEWLRMYVELCEMSRGKERERETKREGERESESESETQDMASFGRFGVEALGLGLRSGPASKSISS